MFREVYSYGPQFKEQVMSKQGVKLIFFSNSHLAPKFFKVVANSKKSWSSFSKTNKTFFYAVSVLGRTSKIKVGKRS